MEGRWIDISQPLTNEMEVWPGDTPFQYKLTYDKESTGSVNIGQLTSSVHTGTHADAPFHFDEHGKTIDEIDVNTFIGKAKVIDLSNFSVIGKKELEQFDLTHVTRLLLKTTTSQNPLEFPEKYTLLTEDIGPFLKEKGINLLGVDMPSVDALDSKQMLTHHSLNNNGILIIENLQLATVAQGYYDFIALPLHIKGSDGSPVRAVIRPCE